MIQKLLMLKLRCWLLKENLQNKHLVLQIGLNDLKTKKFQLHVLLIYEHLRFIALVLFTQFIFKNLT